MRFFLSTAYFNPLTYIKETSIQVISRKILGMIAIKPVIANPSIREITIDARYIVFVIFRPFT